jgi:hypothetical protein
MSSDNPFRTQSIPSTSSLDAFDVPEVLSITVDGHNEGDRDRDTISEGQSSYSFVPVTNSPGQKNRRRLLSGQTKDSSVNVSASASGQSTPTGKFDAGMFLSHKNII